MRRRQWLVVLLTTFPVGCLRFESTDSGRTTDGNFEIRYADENGTLQTVIERSGVAGARPPRQNSVGDGYAVRITLAARAAERLVTTLRDVGAFERPQEHPIFVYFDGREVYSFQLSPGLIQTMQSGDFRNDPSFNIVVKNESLARDLSDSLQD